MIEFILFFIGIVFLVKSADYLVEGSSSLARRMGISALVCGLTIVAFGTSLPELVVNVFSSLEGNGDIAFGNIIGSNMANTLLILGIMALITTLNVKSSTIWKEIPFSFLSVLVLFIFSIAFLLNGYGGEYLYRTEGIVLLLLFFIFLYYLFELAKKDKTLIKEVGEEVSVNHSILFAIVMVIGGLIGIFLGGKWTVDGAIVIARALGMSEFLISATIVAIGTSLPELVTSIVSASKKNVDLAIGNLVGSNIFNILLVLGITSIISPIHFSSFVKIDLVLLLFVTFLLFCFMFVGNKHRLDKGNGIIFILLYICYIIYIFVRG